MSKKKELYAELKSLSTVTQLFEYVSREETFVYGFALGKVEKHPWLVSVMKYINYTEFDIDKVGNVVVSDILKSKKPSKEMKLLDELFEMIKMINGSMDLITKRAKLLKLEKCLKLCVSNLNLLDPLP